MPPKRKAVALKSEQPKIKQVKRQSDLLSGFASQLLKSPKKALKVQEHPSSQLSCRSLELDDAIEISSGEEGALPSIRVSSQSIPHSRKSNIYEGGSLRRSKLEVSQDDKRRMPSNGNKDLTTVGTQTESSNAAYSWLEDIKLRKSADLAVHKKKITDVQQWITAAFRNVTDHTILILTGPAGVGKTATVETLATEMDFEIIEWRNPMSLDWTSNTYNREADSLAQKFDRFLSISDKYAILDFGQGGTDEVDLRRKVIVVEDIPNTFSSSSGSSAAKLAFQDSIRRYLSSPRNKYPLILIITETEPRGEDGDWRRSDAMSMRTLTTREILEARNCSQITFNEIAPTFISKALARLVDNLPRADAIDISQAVLDEIAQNANGDIRSAINTLQFISHRFSTYGKAPKARKRKKRGEVLTLSRDEERILSIITNRESALGYFHAIGKVIYNKRIPDHLNSIPYDSLASHLSAHARRRPENDPPKILDETSTDVPTFLMGIHQNYIDSCTDTDQASGVVDSLSDADCLTHGFSQDYSSLTTIAGVQAISGALQNLPQSVKRNHASKVYFPAFSKLLKAQYVNQELLDQFANPTSSSVGKFKDLEQLCYAWQIAQKRGGEAIRQLAGYRKVVQMQKFSTLGRGGIDEKAGLVDEEVEEDDDKDHQEQVAAEKEKPGAEGRGRRSQTASKNDEEVGDEIEEVD